jgi:predicted esterase|tara:strand:+ start:1228 stop:1869 length:642 start_codon:yes stop_codon:yes gene_type:complete
MQKKFIQAPRTARYYLIGNTKNPDNVWLCMHGYGQQAKYFAAKTKALDNGKNLIIVVEAMNRFYLSGYNGRVGATWMTSDDREVDIVDNHRYLDLLLQTIISDYSLKNCPFNLLAFSQGIATACRWLVSTEFKFQQIILWAGSIPTDIDWESEVEKFNKMKVHYVFGEQDEFFNSKKINENTELLAHAKINYQLTTFEGKHELKDEVLASLIK